MKRKQHRLRMRKQKEGLWSSLMPASKEGTFCAARLSRKRKKNADRRRRTNKFRSSKLKSLIQFTKRRKQRIKRKKLRS